MPRVLLLCLCLLSPSVVFAQTTTCPPGTVTRMTSIGDVIKTICVVEDPVPQLPVEPPPVSLPSDSTIVKYEFGVWTPGVDTTIGSPFQITVFPLDRMSCGHAISDPVADNSPNPAIMGITDPADATKECRFSVRDVIISLPLATGYHAGLRGIAADDRKSDWVMLPYSFRRAPRGQPCANTPGVEIVGEADLNGKPIRVTFCIQQ